MKTLDGLSSITELLGRSLKAAIGLEVDFRPVGLSFAPDMTLIAGLKPTAFRVERKNGVGFDTNHYYSSAPLPTVEHMRVLERLEKLAS